MDINISIKNKIATGDGTVIVCGNSDYTVKFDFDEEWTADPKTMRVQCGSSYTDVVFTGESVDLPVIANERQIQIGVFAGDLRTTTPAYFDCYYSIRCKGGAPVDPTDDVYDQIIEMIKDGQLAGATFTPAVDESGNISWTNDKELPNPETKNIKGDKGDRGSDATVTADNVNTAFSIATDTQKDTARENIGAVGVEDYATGSTAGLSCVGNQNAGTGVQINTQNHLLYTVPATNAQIAGKTLVYPVITPNNLDYAIEQGLGNNALTWTDTEKASARATIGAMKDEGVYELIEEITLTEDTEVIERTTEPNGTAYDFSSVRVEFKLTARSGSANFFVMIYLNKNNTAEYLSCAVPAEKTYESGNAVNVESRSGWWRAEWIAGSLGFGKSSNAGMFGLTHLIQKNDNICKIKLYSNGGAKIGDVFRIYGVRA